VASAQAASAIAAKIRGDAPPAPASAPATGGTAPAPKP